MKNLNKNIQNRRTLKYNESATKNEILITRTNSFKCNFIHLNLILNIVLSVLFSKKICTISGGRSASDFPPSFDIKLRSPYLLAKCPTSSFHLAAKGQTIVKLTTCGVISGLDHENVNTEAKQY